MNAAHSYHACVFAALMSAANAGTVYAKQLVIKGTPVVRVTSSPDESHRQVLSSGQQNEFQLLITKDNDEYVWESRDQHQLVTTESGIFSYFVAPTTGWIKVGSTGKFTEVLKMASAAGIDEDGLMQLVSQNFLTDWMLEHKYFYFEFITMGMFTGVYWGYADEFDP